MLGAALLGLVASLSPPGWFAYDAPPAIPHGWTRGARAEPSAPLELHFLLRQQNVDRLEAALDAVSYPTSASYGRHLSNDEVNAMVAPTPQAISAVREYISSHGAIAHELTPNADILRAELTVREAERALGCEYYEYRHEGTGETALRTASYALPRALSAHLAAVAPTTMLHSAGRPHGPRAVSAVRRARPDAIINTPKTLRALYGLNATQADPSKAPGNKQAVTAFLGESYSPGDYTAFQKTFLNATAMGYNLTTAQLVLKGDDGGAFPLGGTEAMLDAEYITAMGANIPTEFWGFKGDDSPPQALWLKMMAAIANTSDAEVPKIFSTSYGEDESYLAEDYAVRLNTEYMKAGARGISLLFSSGDTGGAGEDPKTKGCPHKKFVPKWPTASPYVTSVGGTESIGSYQMAAGLSSGGFSDRWARPKWQEKAAANYLAKLNATTEYAKLASHINHTAGRGFPDLSAEIAVYAVAARLPMPVEGTSVSSPTVAGVFGLLNGVRLAANKPPLGFLNPLIYGELSAALHDISDGSRGDGCKEDDGDGFPALQGWDAVTGVGSPDWPAMRAVVAGLP